MEYKNNMQNERWAAMVLAVAAHSFWQLWFPRGLGNRLTEIPHQKGREIQLRDPQNHARREDRPPIKLGLHAPWQSISLITHDRGEPAVSYRWTGWVWEITGWKFKTSGKSPVVLEEFMEYTPNLIKENRRMWQCNRLDLQIPGSQPVIMPKNLPDHCS